MDCPRGEGTAMVPAGGKNRSRVMRVNYPSLKGGACTGNLMETTRCNLIRPKVALSSLIRAGRLTRPLPIIR